MLAIQTYRFLIGSKLPFSEWPSIVKAYLENQGLHYRRFAYYFEDNYGALPKMIKDCPQIGPIRMRTTDSGNHFYLTNIEDENGCTEQDIMDLMPKIHRRYRISESSIMFQDIDFFARQSPVVVHAPCNTPACIKGVGITCYRDAIFPRWSSIDLHIITHDGQQSYDPTPYFEAMKRHLPGIRYMSFVECCLSDQELQYYEGLNRDAVGLINAARDYLCSLLPNEPEQTAHLLPTQTVSVAPVLKRMCKQHGYTYVKYEYHTFFIQKRTPNGHYILLDIDVGPRFGDVNLLIRYTGVGFEHRLASCGCLPDTAAALEQHLSQCFRVLSCAEKEVFPALDAHFPTTPDWFVPIQ